jgi:peptidyl-tRNA hydrolase
MNFKHIPLIVCVLFVSAYAHAQAKVLGECTIQFNIQQQQKSEWVAIGSKKVLIKGNQCKTILATPQLVQTLIFNLQQEKAIVTKEVGNNKYLQ